MRTGTADARGMVVSGSTSAERLQSSGDLKFEGTGTHLGDALDRVRERRGEKVAEAEPGRVVDVLQYVAVSAIGLGIVILVAGWTVAPGQP